jgi:putative ABC transport system permease protein
MGYLLKMAVRNLMRNKRRTALALISVALSALLCVFLQGFMGGFTASIVKNYTKNQTGHVRITTVDFQARSAMMPVDANVADPAAVESKIESDPELKKEIATIAQRFRFGVLLANQGRNASAVALAGDPEVEKGLLSLQKSISRGRYIQGPGEAIVGSSLASELSLSLGDELKVVTEASDGSIQLKKLRIVGLFTTGVADMDESTFQMTLADAKRLLRTGDGTQSIIVMLKDYRGSEEAARRISALLNDKDLAVTPWTAIGDYSKLIKFDERVFNDIMFVVLFLGAFIITNIMTMVVMERRREIGILKSMGFSRAEVLVLFLWEGALLGLLGGLAGSAAGLAVNTVFALRGMDFSAALGTLKLPMDNVVYTVVSLPVTLGIVLLATLVAGLVSLVPSRRAARMNAVDSIKSV